MDRRKIEQFKESEQANTGEISDNLRMHQIINSKKVNEALLDNVEQMFDLEFTLK